MALYPTHLLHCLRFKVKDNKPSNALKSKPCIHRGPASTHGDYGCECMRTRRLCHGSRLIKQKCRNVDKSWVHTADCSCFIVDHCSTSVRFSSESCAQTRHAWIHFIFVVFFTRLLALWLNSHRDTKVSVFVPRGLCGPFGPHQRVRSA